LCVVCPSQYLCIALRKSGIGMANPEQVEIIKRGTDPAI
jgi:hypothetical protein